MRKICLELKRVCVEIDHERILKEIDLVVFEQEIVSIIGPNGAGKTTLFNTICGQLRATSGKIYFHDKEITHWPAHRICHSGIARTFQIARPFFEMTALENVLIALWFGKKAERNHDHDRDAALELLRIVQLERKADTRARDLTLSEQRRLEVARALGTKPHLLLLDEIAAGLSPQAINQAVELVKSLRDRGLTLLIIDHFLNLTVKVSDRLVAMDQGEKIAEGSPSKVLQSKEVVAAYLGERRAREDGAGDDQY